MKCCLCGQKIQGYGNNASPLKDGMCCDACNYNFVIPARVSQIMKHKVNVKITIEGVIEVEALNQEQAVKKVYGERFGNIMQNLKIKSYDIVESKEQEK